MLGPGSQVWAECEQSVLLSDFLPADGRVRKEEELSNVLYTDNSWSAMVHHHLKHMAWTDTGWWLHLTEAGQETSHLTASRAYTLHDIINWT